MTNEQTISNLKKLKSYHNGSYGADIDRAIKALEQQSNTDKYAISRQALLDAFGFSEKTRKWGGDHSGYDTMMLYEIQDVIESQPPVKPQEPKTGHWIETAEEYYKAVNEYGGGVNENTPYFVDDIACSECLAKYSMLDNETQFFKHCPNCGAKMIEPQERSDKG